MNVDERSYTQQAGRAETVRRAASFFVERPQKMLAATE
jgi:hypothetical protein